MLAWLSGTAWVAPGSTMPSSGATTCEMPCSGSSRSKSLMSLLAAALAHRLEKRRARRVGAVVAAGLGGDGVILHREGEVGPPHRPLLLLAAARRRAARAARAARAGRYRSRSRPSARRATRCASQILSNRVAGMVTTLPESACGNRRGPRALTWAVRTKIGRDAGRAERRSQQPHEVSDSLRVYLGGKKIHPRMSTPGVMPSAAFTAV